MRPRGTDRRAGPRREVDAHAHYIEQALIAAAIVLAHTPPAAESFPERLGRLTELVADWEDHQRR